MIGGSITRLGCVVALAVATLTAPALARAGGHSAAPHKGHRGVQVQGQKSQRITPFSTASGTSSATISGQLVDHGGPVMATNTVHAIYWFPSGYPLDSTWRSYVDGYLGNVAADSGTTSNVFSVGSQYGVGYNAHFAGSAVDTTPFPASGCGQGVGGKPCLTEEQIFNELSSFAQAQGWPADPNAVSGSNPTPSSHPTHLFIVYLPQGVADCFDNSQGICSANSSDPYYCAYHTAWNDNSQTYIWANMPWSWNVSGCGTPKAPNLSTADNAIDTTSHEYVEALTDPFLNAWYDSNGYEIADKCQTAYGSPLQTSGNYNQLINGGRYWTELEYSNKLHDCYQLGQPVVSTMQPAAAVAGATVKIAGQNFFGSVSVRFNGLVAPIVSVTPTLVTVKVPSGDSFGPVVVQAIGGSGTSATAFGYPRPVIDTAGPLDGKIGTTVTLTGSSFTGVTAVKFGTVADTTFSVVDDGTITAHVPATFSLGKITLVYPGGTVATAQSFQVTKVTGITPLAAKAGALVTITGQGLGSTQTVDFPNHPGVAVAKTTATSVQVVVPSDATGPGPLVVHTPNIDVAGIATASFKATPTITSFTRDGKVGGAVTITGANLGGATAVKFGTVSAAFDTPSATSITAYAPNSSGAITVVTPHGSVVTALTFAITKVTGFSVASGAAGATVTIVGTGLTSTASVDFGGSLAVPVVSTTATSATVKVPGDATIGPLVVHTPNIDAAGLATPKAFKPLPRVTTFDASDYQVGATVTATGTNLAEAGSYVAKIGALVVGGLSVTDAHTLTFQIPAGATTGALTFVNAAGTTTSAVSVKIRPTIAGFAPANAIAGARITLTGATFNGTTGVAFGTVRAATFSVGAGGATLAVIVPAAAVDGPITVTNAGGATASVDAFHVDPVIAGFTPATGAVGTTVIVTGTGLKNVTSVEFGGGVSAAPIATTATALKVIVPAGATSGPIAVHSGTSSAAARGAFAVTLSITSFSQPFAAPGATVTINGVGLTNVSAVKFGTLSATISAQSGSSLSVVVPAITGDVTVSVTKGTTTIQAPSQFGLFAVTSTSPAAVTAGGTLTVAGSNLSGATAKFAGVDTPVALDTNGKATVPSGFTGGTVTIADAYGDAIDQTVALFAIQSYSVSHAGPGDSVTITLAGGGDYSSSTVHVKFPGAGQVTATGGNGTVQVAVPAGATSGALQVEAGASGWATGGAFTVDRATVVLDQVQPNSGGAQIELLVTAGGGLGDTTITWKQSGSSHTVDLAAQSVQTGDLIVVQTGIASGDVTIEVGTPLGAEDGLALGTSPDTAWLQSDGVWGSTGAVDWSTLTAGQSVTRIGDATPDDVANWSVA